MYLKLSQHSVQLTSVSLLTLHSQGDDDDDDVVLYPFMESNVMDSDEQLRRV